VWGLAQPFTALLADRCGATSVVAAGLALYALGLAGMAWALNATALVLTGGVCIAIALSGTAFGVVYAALSRLVAPERRAWALGLAPSTISREIGRNAGQDGYRASVADEAAGNRALRPKLCKLVKNRALAGVVSNLLRMLWSPEQIAGWLTHTYPNDPSLHVSHETIYRSLFIQARGALKKELLEHLRRTRGMRRSRSYTQKTAIHGQIADAVSISARPASVEDRAVPGHWEGDLVFGSGNSQIATLVERQTRYVMLVKLEGKDSQSVVNVLIKNARKLPQELYKSLTWDRGTEMHGHKRFTMATDIQVYFCDPQSPWQRGSNENTNGLLRQYMPKGINISGYSQLQLNAIARQLNERPRKTLGFHTPAEMFSECVALTS
jgi:IS30 family transposase